MAGFDISKCGPDAQCKDVVQRLTDSCFVANMNDSAADKACKDQYIGEGVPFSDSDPIYKNVADANKPITQADYDHLQSIRGGSGSAAPATPPAGAPPATEQAGPPAPAQSWGDMGGGAAPGSAVPGSAVGAGGGSVNPPPPASEQAYLPYDEFQRKHVNISAMFMLNMHSTTEGGLSYQDDVAYEGDNQSTQKNQNFALPGLRFGFDWNFSHLAKASEIADRIAKHEIITHEELLTPWEVGLGVGYEVYFLDSISRYDEAEAADVNENKGTAHSLQLRLKADYRVNRYLGFGGAISYGNFFSYDGMSLNIEQDKQYKVFGAGDTPYVHALGAEVSGRVHANERFDVVAGFSYRRFFTYGEELYNGANGDIGINMFMFNIGVSLGLGDVHDFILPEDAPKPQSVEDYYVVSKVNSCAYAAPENMAAQWKADFDKSKSAVEANPEDHEAMYMLAKTAAGLGRKNDADKAQGLLRKIHDEKVTAYEEKKNNADMSDPTQKAEVDEMKKELDMIKGEVTDLARFIKSDLVQRNYECRAGKQFGEKEKDDNGNNNNNNNNNSDPSGGVSGWGNL